MTKPEPMTPERLEEIRQSAHAAQQLGPAAASVARPAAELIAHIDALTARIANLERRCEIAEAHELELRQIVRVDYPALKAELAAARKPPEEVEMAAACLRKIADDGVADSLDRENIKAAADLLTRLSVALKEAEHMYSVAENRSRAFEGRALAAEGKLETARLDALEEAATRITPDEARRQANKLMCSPEYINRNHPEHAAVVERVQRLFEMAYS